MLLLLLIILMTNYGLTLCGGWDALHHPLVAPLAWSDGWRDSTLLPRNIRLVNVIPRPAWRLQRVCFQISSEHWRGFVAEFLTVTESGWVRFPLRTWIFFSRSFSLVRRTPAAAENIDWNHCCCVVNTAYAAEKKKYYRRLLCSLMRYMSAAVRVFLSGNVLRQKNSEASVQIQLQSCFHF